jgi:hypothetical protein
VDCGGLVVDCGGLVGSEYVGTWAAWGRCCGVGENDG